MIKVDTNMRSWDPIRELVLVLVSKGFHPWVGIINPNPYYKNNGILMLTTKHKGTQKPPLGLTPRVPNTHPLVYI